MKKNNFILVALGVGVFYYLWCKTDFFKTRVVTTSATAGKISDIINGVEKKQYNPGEDLK